MGVPGFFGWLLKQYKEHKMLCNKLDNISTLYIDANCLIHPQCRIVADYCKDIYDMERLEKKMFQRISNYLDFLLAYANPQDEFFIEIDEFDKRERRLLNFGHSFGHALEAASEYKIPHGIAVFVGIQAAIFRSKNNKPCEFLSTWIKSQVNEFIFDFQAFTIEKNKFLQSLARDKKNTSKYQILILPNTEGRLEEISFDLSDSNLELCWQSLITSLDMLGFKYEIL